MVYGRVGGVFDSMKQSSGFGGAVPPERHNARYKLPRITGVCLCILVEAEFRTRVPVHDKRIKMKIYSDLFPKLIHSSRLRHKLKFTILFPTYLRTKR